MLDLNIYPDMATIYIDNLVKPRQTNSPYNFPAKETPLENNIYADLHLDLKAKRKLGVGNAPVNSSDIIADTDTDAIRNALYNLFTTRPGQKLLNPAFGSSLEQFLFESVNELNARIIGDTIYTSIRRFEPRVEVLKVQVTPEPDLNQYRVVFVYKLLNKGDSQSFSIEIQSNNNITIV